MSRLEISQGLCDHVRILLAGGATAAQAAQITGTGEATVSRIKRAGFSAEVYRKNKEARRKPAATMEAEKANIPEEVPGQICMDLQPAQQGMSEQTKLMRFQAAQVEKVIGQMMVNEDAILMKLERLNDTLCMLLRAIRKE